jgi:hypothetical protein
MEDQLGALGLGLNAIIYWNSLYIDAAVKKLAAGGMEISPEIRAHLSPLQWAHINFHGTYPFNRRTCPAGCGMRCRSGYRPPLPAQADTAAPGRDAGMPRPHCPGSAHIHHVPDIVDPCIIATDLTPARPCPRCA